MRQALIVFVLLIAFEAHGQGLTDAELAANRAALREHLNPSPKAELSKMLACRATPGALIGLRVDDLRIKCGRFGKTPPHAGGRRHGVFRDDDSRGQYGDRGGFDRRRKRLAHAFGPAAHQSFLRPANQTVDAGADFHQSLRVTRFSTRPLRLSNLYPNHLLTI